MHNLPPLIIDLAVILGVAGIVTLLFQKIRQPIVLGYLISGIIIGPYTPPHTLVSDIPNIKILSELGIIFLMFFLGLDFSFRKLARVGLSAGLTGLIEVVLMILIGFGTGKLLHWSFYDCLFLGAALAISSTTIIIKAVDELGLLKTRFAELMFGVLVVEDLIAILLLVVLTTFVTTHNIILTDVLASMLQLILVVGGWFILGYFLIPTLLQKIMQYANNESMTVFSLGLCLFLVCIAAYFNYSIALGAFIMGSILAETPLVSHIERLIQPIKDMFAALFFVSVGMLVNPELIIKQWPAVISLTLITIFGKLIVTSLGAFLTGQSINTALRVGFGMAQVGEFSFIIAGLGIALNVTSSALYPIIVAVSCLTTFTTPYLIRLSGVMVEALDGYLPSRVKYFLDAYAASWYRASSDTLEQALIKKAILRFMINGIVLAIIFTLIYQWVLPKALLLLTHAMIAKTLCWLMALVLASPFLWGMLITFNSNRASLPKQTLGLHSFRLIIVLLTLVELLVLSLAYFQTWLMFLLLLGLMLGVFIFFYQTIEKTYHWFEGRFLKNIECNKQSKMENVAFWDLHPVELTVGKGAELAGKTLAEVEIRQRFGINIVAIFRHFDVILTPNGNEQLLPYDQLVVLGNDAQIEAFRQKIEPKRKPPASDNMIKNFALKTLLLHPHHALIGKTIRMARALQEIQGLVVGIERNGMRILNPDSTTILEAQDLLFIYG